MTSMEEGMMWILRDSRARSWFFNIGLVIVFIAAWVSDKWPELAMPAIAAACSIVLFQAGFLYFAASRSKIASDASNDVTDIAENVVAASVAFAESDAIRLNTLDVFSSFEKMHRNVLSNMTSSQPISWVLTSFPDITADRILAVYRDVRVAENLAEWKYTQLPGRAFNVDAGAFTIEHTNDHTVIVVHDSSRVTVEDDSFPTLRLPNKTILLQ